MKNSMFGWDASAIAAAAGSFVDQVLRAARKAGHDGSYTTGRRRSTRYGHSTFGRGRAAFGRSRLFAGHRRVVVKARVVRHLGRAFRSALLAAHIALPRA